MKTKVSATVDRRRLAEARRLTGSNNVSAVLDEALAVLVRSYLEAAHAEGYARLPQDSDTIALPDPSVWSDLPWDGD